MIPYHLSGLKNIHRAVWLEVSGKSLLRPIRFSPRFSQLSQPSLTKLLAYPILGSADGVTHDDDCREKIDNVITVGQSEICLLTPWQIYFSLASSLTSRLVLEFRCG